MNSFANMLNRKVFLKSSKTTYIAVEQSFLVQHLKSFVGDIYVDEPWYLDVNPDVQDAIASGLYASARDHYCFHGYYEHRMPYAIKVHETWYLNEYEDIKSAVQDGAYRDGQSHFEELGYKEGRFPYPDFVLRHGAD